MLVKQKKMAHDKEYKDRLTGIADAVAVFTTVNIAKDMGFLQLFLSPHEPMTAAEIASKAKLKDRYVKELLGCLVSGRLIEIDAASEKYFLSAPLRENLKSYLPFLDAINYGIERTEDIKECLKIDGPLGYAGHTKPRYGEVLQNLQELDIDKLIEKELFSYTPDIKLQLEKGVDFIEFGCAYGPVILRLAERFPNSRFVASDYSETAMTAVDRVIKEKGLKNITARQANLHSLHEDWTGKFDIAYEKDALHDMGNPFKGVEQMAKVTKDGGVFLIVELGLEGENQYENIGRLEAAATYFLSTGICIPESLSQGGTGWGGTFGPKAWINAIKTSGVPSVKIEHFVLESSELKFVCRK